MALSPQSPAFVVEVIASDVNIAVRYFKKFAGHAVQPAALYFLILLDALWSYLFKEF